MKYYPKLSELAATREMVDVFKGYNHNLRIGSGEFYDMKNLTSNDYPVLSPRPKRGVYVSSGTPQGMIAKDTLCYVDSGDFVIGGDRVSMGLTIERDSEGNIIPKNLISMGAYVIIMPDKKYINTSNLLDHGNIEASFTTTGAISFLPCTLEGADLTVYIADTAQKLAEFVNIKDQYDYCLDATVSPHVLKQYSTSSGSLESIATTYIKISSPGIGSRFEVYDGVKIEGIENETLADLNNVMPIWAKGDDYIVVTSVPAAGITQESPITVTRQMPNMDFVIESENRLWGCRYGKALNGEMVNEIYASKLGDFRNWNCFMGVTTDSYAVTVGTDGAFTGAIAYLGYPLFFKEGCMHKIYGNYPSNYQVTTTSCRGVQKGCSRSLAIVNETLLYKSRTAVCAYDGALPYEISAPLGDIRYSNATAGTIGNKYYISMLDDKAKYNLFVYDVLKGMWHREDDARALAFCNSGGDLYFIDVQDHIKSIRGTGEPETAPIEWEATTGIIGTDSPDKKYISRLDVRMSLVPGARVYIYAQYDSVGAWEQLYASTGIALRSFAVPIRPRRCDHLRLKIVGVGEAKIYSICKTIEQGSDV
jgi:hypothetical protein